MNNIYDLQKRIITFRDNREWGQFHNPKDIAISISLEASELLEHFQWKSKEEIEKYVITNKDSIGDEIADILNYILILAHDLGLDVLDALKKKINKNEEKYPEDKARGNHKKYTEL